MEVKQIRREGTIKKVTISKKSALKVGDYVAIVPIKNLKNLEVEAVN